MEQEPQGQLAAPRGTGLIWGRFSPVHAGHQHLIEVARSYCQRLIIALEGGGRDTRYSTTARRRWLETIAPDARVITTDSGGIDAPWARRVSELAGGPIATVFGERSRGHVAELLEAKYVPVARQPALAPPSREVEAAPLFHWDALSRGVRADLATRVAIVGPESSGKSTLAAELARRYGTLHVGEYVRPYLDLLGRTEGTLDDIEAIARGQLAAEDALAGHTNRILFCDTNLVATIVWSQMLFGQCPQSVVEANVRRRYALVLVTAPDVPYTADPQRCQPDLAERQAFFAKTLAILETQGVVPTVIDGPWEGRLAKALEALEAISLPIL